MISLPKSNLQDMQNQLWATRRALAHPMFWKQTNFKKLIAAKIK
jgi:hypothetical protein